MGKEVVVVIGIGLLMGCADGEAEGSDDNMSEATASLQGGMMDGVRVEAIGEENEGPSSVPDAATAEGSAEDPEVASPSTASEDPQEVALGQRIFHGLGGCASCHGANGQGSFAAPSLNDDRWTWIDREADLKLEIARVIRSGVMEPREFSSPMAPMGGVQLSDVQIAALAAYIASL